ncbi:MAG: flippase-like domain-containing protein [Anaerolineae bacterium]|nr:flippase-like domain-containing protein [Anaerolineae bacterium]
MSLLPAPHPPPAPGPARRLWHGFSLLIGLVIISTLISLIDWAHFLATLRQLSAGTLAALTGVYLLLNGFRVLRFQALLTEPAPARWLYPIGLYHNLLVRVLPFKLGELAHVLLLRRHLGFSAEAGLSSLLGARLLELMVILLVGAVSLPLAGDLFAGQQALQAFFIAGSVIIGLPALYWAGPLLRRLAHGLRRVPLPLLPALAPRLERLAAGFDLLRQPRRFARAFAWSVCTYSCSFLLNAILLQAAGVPLPLPLLVVIVTLGMFASAFPFNISGFGMVEMSWTFALTTLAGYDSGTAAAIGLLLNGVPLLITLVCGLLGRVWLRLSAGDSVAGTIHHDPL